MLPADEPRQFFQYNSSSGWEQIDSRVISEAPVTLFVNGESWLTFMCTPTHLEALGVGFLFNEGIITSASEISVVTVCKNGCQLDIWLNRVVDKPEHWRRTSGCTGGVTAADTVAVKPVEISNEILPPEFILAGMDDLLRLQELYRSTRGVHCSMLTDGEGTSLLAEDIGRHNTLDKLAGRLLREQPTLRRRMVFTTGRISSEMLQKSVRLGACAIVSRTSPTALSIRLAEELGVTLIGYARRNQFNVYAHAERVRSAGTGYVLQTEQACEAC